MNGALGCLGDKCYAAIRKLVLNANNAVFVARNGPGRKNDRVATIELNERVFALGNAGKRGLRLALATGYKGQHIVARREGIAAQAMPPRIPPAIISGSTTNPGAFGSGSHRHGRTHRTAQRTIRQCVAPLAWRRVASLAPE